MVTMQWRPMYRAPRATVNRPWFAAPCSAGDNEMMCQLSILRLLALIGLLLAQGAVAAATATTITDQRGKAVTFAAPPQRMVVIPIPMASVIMTLDGSSRRVVGMHPAARQSITGGFLQSVFPEARFIPADITRGGQFTPNVESILALRADTVVTWTEPAEAVQTLERAGLRVVALTNNPSTREQHESNLRIVAQMLGRTEQLKRILAEQARATTAVEQAVAEVTPGERPQALYFRQFTQSLIPGGTGTFPDYWLRMAGARNVAESLRGLSTPVTAEQVVAWNPQVIFLGAFDDATPADVYAMPALAGVDAVRFKKVYKVPHGGYRWDPGSHESHLTFLWAARVLHPKRAPFNVRAELRRAYEFLYQRKLTDEIMDEILALAANRGSAHYVASFARQWI